MKKLEIYSKEKKAIDWNKVLSKMSLIVKKLPKDLLLAFKNTNMSREVRAGLLFQWISSKEINFLTKHNIRSADWVTCACGSICKALPRMSNGVPADAQLTRQGSYFHKYIGGLEVNKAKETLKTIENRSAYLINKEFIKQVETIQNKFGVKLQVKDAKRKSRTTTKKSTKSSR